MEQLQFRFTFTLPYVLRGLPGLLRQLQNPGVRVGFRVHRPYLQDPHLPSHINIEVGAQSPAGTFIWR